MFSNLRENLNGEITLGVSPKSLERILQRHKTHKMSLFKEQCFDKQRGMGCMVLKCRAEEAFK